MKVTIFMTLSANGMIAKKGGSLDFLEDSGSLAAQSFGKVECCIMGRKAYDSFQEMGYFDFLSFEKAFVVTRQLLKSENERVVFTMGTPYSIIEEAREQGSREVLILGGNQIATLFLNAEMVDEMILHTESKIIPNGIGLGNNLLSDISLKLIDCHQMNDNIIETRYTILR